MMPDIASIDQFLAQWFRDHLTSLFADILWVMSAPGDPAVVAAVVIASIVVLLRKKHWHALTLLLLTVPVGTLMGEGLKLIFQRPRPFLEGHFGEFGGYSFPSGHTIAAALLYIFLASAILPRCKRRRWQLCIVGGAATLVFSVALSRIALGAHYLTDVLAAMTIGSVWAFFCSSRVRAWRQSRLTPALDVSPTNENAAEIDG